MVPFKPFENSERLIAHYKDGVCNFHYTNGNFKVDTVTYDSSQLQGMKVRTDVVSESIKLLAPSISDMLTAN